MQDVGDWVTFSDHSAAQLAAYVGQGLGFDAVHAAGCLAFALALGPVLTRSIQRFARRITVTWIAPERVIAPLLVAALALGALGSRIAVARAARATSPSSLTAAAANYLLGSENADGGFGSAPGQPSDQLYAGWAALGLASAGHDLNQLGDAESLVSYIARGAGTHDVGALERTILVVRAAGRSPRSFGGRDLIAALQSHVRGDGSISDQVNLTAFAILALHADGLAPSGRTLGWLAHQQDSDGGFSFAGRGGSSDVDDTGAALEALAGEHAPASADLPSGGVPAPPTGSRRRLSLPARHGLQRPVDGVGDPGAPSGRRVRRRRCTAGGRLAAGLPRLAGGRQRRGALQPRVTQTPVWVTGEALMAMEGKPLPIAAPAAPAAPSTPARPPASTHTATTPHVAPSRPATSKSAAAHTGAGRPRPQHPLLVAPVSIARNQVLAGNFAHAIGVITALALAPVGLG